MEKVVEISEIELLPIHTKKGLTFFASCVLDGRYFIGNIALFTRLNGKGFRCVYPTKVLANGSQISIFYPINKLTGTAIEKKLSEEATRLLDKPGKKLIGKYIFGRGDRE